MRGKTLCTGGRYPIRRQCRHLATLYICVCMLVCVCVCVHICVHRYVSVKERKTNPGRTLNLSKPWLSSVKWGQ